MSFLNSTLPISRRALLLGLGFFLSLASSLSTAARAADSRPNILFIMSDDHGYQAMSCYGSKVNKTPNLDRIAREGMRFDRCFVTNSICGPSRAVILTGKYSHLNGFEQNGRTFNGQQQTVAKLLQKAGYQTAVVGKWHLRSDPTGFDHYHVLQGQGPYYNPAMKTPTGVVQHTGYTTEIITDEALKWLKNGRDKEKPFYLMYQHKAPHRNWQPGPKYLDRYNDVTLPEPATLFDDYNGRTSAASTQTMTIKKHLNSNDLKLTPQRGLNDEQRAAWDKAYGPKNKEFEAANLEGSDLIRWKYQRYVKDYLRCIDAVDDNVGRVLDYLDESGLAENTIVFYTSDQGWYLGEHGWFDKRWMYEESFRTPLLVRWPGKVKAGSITQDMVMNLDFAETFLDIAGVEIPADMQGKSITSVLAGKTPADWRKSVYYHYYEFPGAHSVQRHYGVRTDRYKLIHFYEKKEWELFDLEKDPNELTSFHGRPEYADVQKELETELQRLREQYKDDGTVEKFGISSRRKVKRKLARQFDFSDAATARLTKQPIVDGQSGKAIKLDGSGPAFTLPSSPQLDPSGIPLTVGAWCKSVSGNGVLIAQGGVSQGYSLYLKDGLPVFALRASMTLKKVTGPKLENDKWTHVAVTLDQDGIAQLLVNGKPVGKPTKVGLVGSRPADGLSVGADSGSSVGEYQIDFPFHGQLEDVRIYWGTIQRMALKKWATP
ncbi:MAG: sulfatase/phosphatase domain-containing protein [Pirellulaceae bacterium]